jgi:enoyl-CoA hydratase
VSEPEVLVGDTDGIRLITLNRPQVRNAVNQALANQLGAALDELDRRDDLRVGVLCGAGGTFCTGMDLRAFGTEGVPLVRGRGFAGIAERSSVKPLVAAVEGYALAGGLEIALACDVIVAARTATFGLPEVRRGLVAAAGGLLRLPLRLPRHVAALHILTGSSFDAELAARFGLVSRLVDDGTAVAEALSVAAEIAANSPVAVRASKRVVDESAGWSREEMFVRQQPIVAEVLGSAEAEEGASAFLRERRSR